MNTKPPLRSDVKKYAFTCTINKIEMQHKPEALTRSKAILIVPLEAIIKAIYGRSVQASKSFNLPTIFPADEHDWNRNRKGKRSGEWGHVSITELDKVLVTSGTSEIAVMALTGTDPGVNSSKSRGRNDYQSAQLRHVIRHHRQMPNSIYPLSKHS